MEMNCGRGTTIFAEGQAAQSVYILRGGRIKLSVTSREGKTMILRIAEAGQVIGLSAALTASEYVSPANSCHGCDSTAEILACCARASLLLASSIRRASTFWFTLASGNFPALSRSPAGAPVRISMPWSTVSIA